MKHFALVYQCGLANLFETGADNVLAVRKRVYQGDFKTGEALARGAKLAGAKIKVFHCNRAGDIAGLVWDADIENAPFHEKMNYKDLRD